MKALMMGLLLCLKLFQANAQSVPTEVPEVPDAGSPEVMGTLIPTPPELDPERNYCVNIAYQVELREHLQAKPEDREAVVRFALLQGLCELVFDGVIDETTAMELWADQLAP